jgi:hypothetical protein
MQPFKEAGMDSADLEFVVSTSEDAGNLKVKLSLFDLKHRDFQASVIAPSVSVHALGLSARSTSGTAFKMKATR